MKDPIELLCSHCGERFKIGLDSQFVTDEDLLQFLKKSGADAVIHVGTPTRKPDLAQHCVLDEGQKIANLRKLDAIILDLAQGEQRAWYCDVCKSANDYPQEWHRGAKKETHPPIPNPKCDVCSKEVMRDTGYSLSTSQVTGDSNYWKFTFLNYPAHIHAIGSDGKRLIPFVIERSGDPSAWLVCDQCIHMFTVEDVDMVKALEMVKARQLCQEQWTEKGALVPRQLGPAQWEQSLIAACEGWKKVFGSEPKPDRDDTAIPAAIAIYTSARVHWEQRSSDSSLVVIGGPAMAQRKAEQPKRKKWWRWLYRRLLKPLCVICLVLPVILVVILLLLGSLALIVENISIIIGAIIASLAVLLIGLLIGHLIETEDSREAKRDERNEECAKSERRKKQIQMNKDIEVIASAIKKLVSSQKPIENFLPIINTKGYESVVSVNYESIAKAILSVDSLTEVEKGRLFSNVEPDFISHILNYFNDSEKIAILKQIEQGKRDDVLMRFPLSKRSQLSEALKE